MTRAAIYSRYSLEQQSEASIEDQTRVCERLAERFGFKVVAHFHDRAVSGGTADRMGYQQLLAAARDKRFDAIVCEDLSRLWRNPAEQGPRLAELQDLGVHIVTVSGLDSRQPGFKVIAGVMGSVNELARDEAAYRSKRGLEGLARSGKSAGGRAYGYRSATECGSDQRQVHAEHADVVRWIFEQYAAGRSPRWLAENLNARKVPSPGSAWNREVRRRGGWLCSAIAGDPKRGTGILNNEMYHGTIVWNRARWIRSAANSKKRRQQVNSKSEWIERTDESLRIVSDSLWNRVKERQQGRSHEVGERVKAGLTVAAAGRTGPGPRHLFSTLLKCGTCNANFVVVNKDKWGCSSHHHGGASACPNDLRLRRDIIENGLLDGIRAHLLSPEAIAEFRRRVTKRIAEQNRQPAPDAKRIAELETQVSNLVDAISSGGLMSSPAIGARLAAAEAELAGMRQDAIPREAVKLDRIIPRIDDAFRKMVADLPNAVKRDLDRSRATVRQYTGNSIRVESDGKTVRFMSESKRLEQSLLIAAGGAARSYTNLVAGA